MHKAKEKASILWLLSKAYNKQIPKELKEPYYKNAQNEDVLKPQIIQGLSNCELYCMALSYIYEDLSYADLDHIGVIHLLIKKGVQIIEPHDIDLTETALIQNAPIRMSAHMAIIDAIMNLFSKDVLIPEKIVEVVSRFAPINADEVPLDLEEVALFWLNKSSERFRQVIEDELNNNETESINYIPCLPFIQDVSELNTGCSLVALLSFYCPEYLNWREVILKEQDEMNEEESIKNLETVQYFCAKYLPYDILFIELDNFIKIKNQFRINILTFISDLLYLFEVKPANCVRKPEYIDDLDYDFKENERINYNNELINNNHQQQINSNDNNNLILLNHNRKKMNDLMPADLLGNRSQQPNWTNDEDEDNINEEIRNQQKRLRNYLKQQQQQQTSNQYDSNEFYLNDNQTQTLPIDKLNNNRLNNDLKSLNLNKESSSSENEFYLVNSNVSYSKNNQLINNQQLNNHNNHHHLNNNNNHHLNSDGSETSSTLSFAKLSKIKNNSISNNLNEVDNPSINLVYSSDQDDYLNKSNNLNMSLIKNKSQKTKRNSFILNESNHNQNNQLTESFKDQKQKYQQQPTEEEDRNELANKLLQIHLKLEEKRKQFEFEKQQIDTFYKTQKRDISNEAFLKALKKDKAINSSNNHSINNNDLNAYEIKESLNTLRNNLPINQLKSDKYYNDIKSSIDILSSGVNDLENDFKLIEEQKMLIKQQNENNIDPLIDYESKHQQLNDGKFYLHNNSDNFDTRSLNHKKLMDNTLNEQLLNLRRNSLQIDNNVNNVNNKTMDNLLNDNNEKGFFIPFDTNKKPKSKPILNRNRNNNNEEDIAIESVQQPHAVGFVIGHDLVNPDPKSEFAKAKKKEFIISQSMKRKAEQEEKLRIKQVEISKKSEEQRKKYEESEKRKEENRLKREAILEQHRLRKLQEQQEKEGGRLSKLENAKLGTLRNRQNLSSLNRSRPKTIHISSNVSSNQDQTNFTSLDFRNHNSSKLVSDHLDAALINFPNSVLNSNFNSPFTNSLRPQSSLSTNSTAIKKLYLNSSNQKHLPSLPPFMLGSNRLHKGSGSSDGVSEIGSTYSEYTGPKLYVKPIQKSNRGIIVNAINIVLGGAVNGPTKKKVLEEINNNDSKHFLILFRGSGMQFRAIYTYNPDIEEVVKLYGTGPKIINNDMIDKFYKYNSGSKNFNEVHTKHLTVTIDAVTIHSQLWSGKKLPIVKKDNQF